MNHILVGLILAVFSTALTAQTQTITALLNSTPSSIELQDNTYISYGCVDNNYILLQEIPIGQNGYIEFSFSNLKTTDEISIGFENVVSNSEYYRFEYNGGGASVQEYSSNPQLLTITEKNNNLFKVVRCGDNISFFEANGKLVQSITADANTKLWARIQVNTATDVLLNATFEPNDGDCPKCADANGTSLYADHLKLTGLTTGATNTVSLMNNVALAPGTHFTVAETVYEAGAAADVSTNSWYAGDGADGSAIASQKITYTGDFPIASGSTICFTLPGSGTGDALLATNFLINGLPSSDFCVMNNGNTADPKININTSTTALFILQGAWTFSNHRGLFYGEYLSAYQHDNLAWIAASQAAINGSGRSRLPNSLVCLAPDNNLPAASCGSGSSLVAENTENTFIKEKENAPSPIAKVYPNPFEQSFSLDLTLAKAEQIRISLVNATGQEIQSLASQKLEKGTHTFVIRPEQKLYAGLYFLSIQTEQAVLVKKVVQQTFAPSTTSK